MKSLGASERNDELTSIARDYNKNIQEMDSLTKAMEINQSRIIQAEKNVQAINRPTQSKLEKPQIDAERLKFNEENLENTYHEKEQIVQSKIDDTSEMIAQTKREKQAQRENITEAVNDRIAKTDTEITQGKQEVQAKSEAVKQKVKERAKDGAFVSTVKEGVRAFKTIVKDNDSED